VTNYGSLAINGVYTPGSLPGLVAGPTWGGVSGAKVMPGNGMSSFADVGYDPAFNPTGATGFSYSAWFRGNPADTRSFQTIVGHSDSSFRAAINASGKLQAHAGLADITSAKVYNDGNWHQFVATFTGTNVVYSGTNTSTLGVNVLYVDGQQVGTSVGGANPGSTLDLMIGNDPQFTNSPYGIGRCFAGQVCEVAFWNGTALSTNDVKSLYIASGQDRAPVVANTVTNTVASGLPAQLAISGLKTAAGWSDPDGDTVTLSSAGPTSALGKSVTSDATYIYYNAPATNEDHFTYIVTDGFLTASGTVYLEPVTSAGASIQNPSKDGSGHPTFRGSGIPGYTYGVERATAITGPWIEAGTVTAAVNGSWTFTDLTQTNPPTIFYRLYYPDSPGNPPQ
jgi:hypothetical protein